jgi:hypothetical protein
MISSFAAQKYKILIASMVILTVGIIVPERLLAGAGEPQKVIHQLRIYEIFDSNKKAFHDRFRDHAMRIMAKYAFKIVAIWESKKDNRIESFTCLNGRTRKRWPIVGRNSCEIRNGSRSRRRPAKLTDRWSERSRIASCI